MRPGVTIALTAVDRRRLGAIIGNRNVPQKHAWRAEIVLLTADGLGTVEIMRRTGKSKTCVWRWQERFAAEGVDGLLRDKTRPPRVPPLGQEVIDQVVALTATEPPHEATHWTGAAMAKAVGVSVSSVQRIWRAHGLAPHRVRRFKLSNDPDHNADCGWHGGRFYDDQSASGRVASGQGDRSRDRLTYGDLHRRARAGWRASPWRI